MRAAALRFWSDVNPNALRLIAATMIMSLLMMGVSSVTRTLFILRLGLGTEFFGIYNSFGALGYMGMSLMAGMLSSRLGLKKSMLLGLAVFTVGFVLSSLVESVPRPAWAAYALITQLVSAGGFAIFSVNASPAIMSTTGPGNRSKTYGMLSAARNFGTLVGMLAGGMLPSILAQALTLSLDDTAPYRIALLACTGINAAGIYAVTRFREGEDTEQDQQFTPREVFPVLPISLILIYVIFSQGAIAVCHSFCNAYMDEELRLSPQFIGILGALGQLCGVIIPFTMPRLSRHLDNGTLMLLASLGSALILLPLYFAEHWTMAGLARMGLMAMGSLWMPIIQIYQMEMVQRKWRPLAFSLLSVALGINYGTLSFFGGYIITEWGYPSLFLICALLTVAGSLILILIQRLPFMQPKYAN